MNAFLFSLTLSCTPEGDPDVEGDEPYECEDGADNDGDGYYDCDDSDCAGAPICNGEGDADSDSDTDVNQDKDKDGYTVAQNDCDDNNPDINPGADEICNNKDDDCNGEKDDDPTDGTTYYEDSDGDNYGNPSSTTEACSKPSGYVTDSTDCDDDEKSAHPGGTETDWDGIDQDCDGIDLNTEACVLTSIDDATDWVSYWAYSVSDVSKSYLGIYTVDLYHQTLYVDADSYTATKDAEDSKAFTTEIDTLQALNTEANPFWLDVSLFNEYTYCDGYVDWTDVPYTGTVDLVVNGNNVTADVNLSSSGGTYVQDDVVMWEYASGGSCDVQTVDSLLGYFGYSILDFFDTAFSSYTNEIGDELEQEIVWYIEYNCSKP